jgi:hypothetical protein
MSTSRLSRNILGGATALVLLILVCATAYAKDITVTSVDRDAARQVKNARHHAQPANTPAARAGRPQQLSNMHQSRSSSSHDGDNDGGRVSRFPADLQFQGGQVVQSAESHPIFVNLASSTHCNSVATCWGNPIGFLHDLGRSDFIHVADQYTGVHRDDRYTVAPEGINVHVTVGANPLTDADIQAIVHAVVVGAGLNTGYDNIFPVFLVPGQDECFDSTFTVCYSPDRPASFAFCAYHSSADFTDIGHVLYNVEPFQDVPGCNVRPGTPNGQLVDSTNDTLSHETIETITDPDGDAWFNSVNLDLFGQEIADECIFLVFTPTSVFSDPSNVILNGHRYAIQTEYNNKRHACTTGA